MKRKQYYKYKNIGRKVYDLELAISLGGSGLGGCTLPAPSDYIKRKHKKIRSRYDRLVKNNPKFNNLVWGEIYKQLNKP